MPNRLTQSGTQAANATRYALALLSPPRTVVEPDLDASVSLKRLPYDYDPETAAPRYEVTAVYNGKTITQVADANNAAANMTQKANGRVLRPMYRLAEVRVVEHDFRSEIVSLQRHPRFQVCLEFRFKPIGPDAKSLFGFNQLFSFEKSTYPFSHSRA